MSNRLIVNYATGGFVRGQERLVASCLPLNQPVACYGIANSFLSHTLFPYGFKVEAMRKASLDHNASTLLWCDASVYATGKGSLAPVFEHIERDGYYLQNQGWNNAQWCHDKALEAFGFTRDEAEKQCQVLGGFWGVSLSHKMGRFLLSEIERHQYLFFGAWNNNARTESADSRCLGHRHDQSVMSLLAAKHQLKTFLPEDNGWCQYGRNPQFLFNIEGCLP
jgi:hypothetical protein